MITYTDTSTRLGMMTRYAFNSEKVLRDAIRKDGNHFIKVDDLKKVDPNPLVLLIVNHALADKRQTLIIFKEKMESSGSDVVYGVQEIRQGSANTRIFGEL